MKEALSHPTRSYRKKLRVARKNVKVAIAKAKNNWILAKCDELNASSSVKGTAGCWKALKEIKNGLTKTRPKAAKMMTKSDGSMCKNGEENAEVFRIHFEKLFDREPDFNIDLFPVPDSVQTISVNIVGAQKELKTASQVLRVPSQPVILGAWARAIAERGEDGGSISSAVAAEARDSLNIAVQLDAGNMEYERDWVVV